MIFLFLRNLSATVIPSLALPLSIVGTFAVMYLLGYSLDNLSLMALTLSVGFVVDDAIVMLENIVRHMEMGETPLRGGARTARKEIGFTILSMTISLAAVFIPVLFMGGIVGRLFHEFAVTIGVAILVSGFVSLSLTPMLCSRFLKPEREQRARAASTRWTERGFDAMLGLYERTLGPALAPPARSSWRCRPSSSPPRSGSSSRCPKGFLPSEDTGPDLRLHRGRAGHRVPGDGREAAARSRRSWRRIPNVAAVMSSVGGARQRAVGNQGIVFAQLKPRDERKQRPTRSSQELRPKFAKIPGIRVVPPESRRRSASAAASRRASTSTRCRARTRPSSTSTRRCSRRRCARCPGCRT